MKELGLQELLRYALSGSIGVASLLLMYPNVASLVWQIEGAGEMTLILGALLVVGTLVYNIHRAVLFPPFFRWIGLLTLGSERSLWSIARNIAWQTFITPWRLWQPSSDELGVDHWRWTLAEKDRRRWDEWGAQTHFLYCTAWATLAAFLFGRYIAFGGYTAGPPSCRARHIFEVFFCVSLAAAMVNNYRLLYSITDERKREKERFFSLLQ